jgi:CubicO group peptidase (beta-lactamase class C family)
MKVPLTPSYPLHRRVAKMKMLLLIMCLAATTAFASAPPPVIASMERSVTPLVVIHGEEHPPVSLAERMSQLNVNAVSIAVVRDRKLDWARAYGFADRERKVAATPDTLFQAGSISKPITALAALQRVNAGKLDLDRNVNDYLKSWKLPDNEFTVVHKVTVRNILNHTAGLTVWGFPGYSRDTKMPSIVDVLDGKGNTPPIRVWKQPDLSWRYSGGGYTILQLLLSDQSGMTFPVMMRESVLIPLGMNHSTYEQPLPEALRVMAASGYDRSGKKVEGDWHVYPEMAAAGLWTTPRDLAKYVIAIQNANLGRTHFLSPQLVHSMLTPGMNNHGLGPVVTPDGLRFGHGGADHGFQAEVTGFLDGRAGVVVMANSDNGGRLAQELILTLGNLYGWPGIKAVERSIAEVPVTALERLVGSYAIPSGEDNGKTEDLNITREHATLVVTYRGVREMTLLPESDLKFFSRDSGREVVFSFEDKTTTMDLGGEQKAVQHGHD